MYLVNESSKLESVNRVHEIGEKSHSLLDHPRTYTKLRWDIKWNAWICLHDDGSVQMSQ